MRARLHKNKFLFSWSEYWDTSKVDCTVNNRFCAQELRQISATLNSVYPRSVQEWDSSIFKALNCGIKIKKKGSLNHLHHILKSRHVFRIWTAYSSLWTVSQEGYRARSGREKERQGPPCLSLLPPDHAWFTPLVRFSLRPIPHLRACSLASLFKAGIRDASFLMDHSKLFQFLYLLTLLLNFFVFSICSS